MQNAGHDMLRHIRGEDARLQGRIPVESIETFVAEMRSRSAQLDAALGVAFDAGALAAAIALLKLLGRDVDAQNIAKIYPMHHLDAII